MLKKQLIITLVIILAFGCFCGCIEEKTEEESKEKSNPIADFTNTTTDVGLSKTDIGTYVGAVQFTDRSSDQDGEIVSWHWDFGDGASSDEQNPWHNYSSVGYYKFLKKIGDENIYEGPLFNVTLTITDDDELTDTMTKTVWAKPNLFTTVIFPKANFTFIPSEGITNQTTIEFNASSSETYNRNVSYQWDFGDGTIVSETTVNTTHRYDIADEYTVKLTLFDEDLGISDYKEKIINVIGN